MANCSTCRYWHDGNETDSRGNDQGECRESSPVADDDHGRMWPLTIAEDFCGMWTPKTLGN